ncbi:MAG: hypothetical protein WD757_06165 [Actinomycetota bacterium]
MKDDPRPPPVRIASALILTLALAGCGSKTPDIQKCVMGYEPPQRFEVVNDVAIPGSGYEGHRVSYWDGSKASLDFTAGNLGDFFEESPTLRGIPLTNGKQAFLFRHGKLGWALLWYEGDRCHQYSIVGAGFPGNEFLKVLTASEVMDSNTAAATLERLQRL